MPSATKISISFDLTVFSPFNLPTHKRSLTKSVFVLFHIRSKTFFNKGDFLIRRIGTWNFLLRFKDKRVFTILSQSKLIGD